MSPRVGTARRAGFTLVELLVVIAIIGVLVGLTVAAVQTVRGRARDLQITADIKTLDTSIGQFRAKNNNVPLPCVGGGPNGTFRLCSSYVNTANQSMTDSWNGNQEWPEIAILKRLFPRIDLRDNGLRVVDGNGDPQPVWPDANGDGTSDNLAAVGVSPTAPLLLDNNQLMVFFLTGAHFTTYSGFSTNPTQPFAWGFGNPPTVPVTGNNSRLNGGAMTEMKPSQLKDPSEVLDTLYPAGVGPQSGVTTPASDRGRRWLRFAALPLQEVDTLSEHPKGVAGRVKWFVDPFGVPYLYMTAITGNNDYPFAQFSGTPTHAWGLGGLKMFPWGGANTPNHISTAPNGPTDGVFPFRDGSYKFTNGKLYQIVSAGKNGPNLNDPVKVSNMQDCGFGPGSKPIISSSGVTFAPFKLGESPGYLDTEPGSHNFSNFAPRTLGARD